MDCFHPLIRDWFSNRFGSPTPPQAAGWPAIAAGRHTLIAAPTGSGKTLAAFLASLDRLFKSWLTGELKSEIDTVYISPLRALSNDIDRNLQQPLTEIRGLAEQEGLGTWPLRTALRTGDTSPSQRQAILRRPPHVLITTPESLYLMLSSVKGREKLGQVKTVIVDEIHSLARDKRGSHLSLTLERLSHLCRDQVTRVGLSATQKPIEQIAQFLVGAEHFTHPEKQTSTMDAIDPSAGQSNNDTPTESGESEPLEIPVLRPCHIVDEGHLRELDLAISVPESELAAICTHEQWAEIHAQLLDAIQQHQSTLIFVNTRRLAERIAHSLREILDEDTIACHHGSLSKERRLDAEQRLKQGQLKAIVATASLELGIDIGEIELVCQIGSPRSIATFLQRIGRSGHHLKATPKGRLFPLTRDELLESIALIRAVRGHRLDAIEMPDEPHDILAQQIIAESACEDWSEDLLYERFRRALPYHRMTRAAFDRIVDLVSRGVNPSNGRGAYVQRDQINGQLRGRRGARLAATSSGGAIPETAEYRVVTEGDGVVVGTVDEDFAIDSSVGSVFLLGNGTWRVHGLRGGDLVVSDAQGMPPNVPFWIGEAPGRTAELSQEVSSIRQAIAAQLLGLEHEQLLPEDSPEIKRLHEMAENLCFPKEALAWLQSEASVCESGALQACRYVAYQLASVGMVPTAKRIMFERFFDESGGTQIIIHSPLGSRINRAWGLALRKCFCRSFDFELQAAADDNGVVLSLSPQHSLPMENLFKMLRPDNGQYLLEQAMLAAPFFQVRWRWNVTRALAVLRRINGKKVPPHLQRFRAEDLLASAFPETVGCLENHHGDVEVPDHPLVQQTMKDCLFEATDITRFRELLEEIAQQNIELVARDTTEPSPFAHELIHANPYAFLDDAPLEERRTRAVATRRSLSPEQLRDLGTLDLEIVQQVRQQAWPTARNADELHDALMSLVILPAIKASEWTPFLDHLVMQGRATEIHLPSDGNESIAAAPRRCWIAAERWPLIQAAYPQATANPPIELPPQLNHEVSRSTARVELVRGLLSVAGPISVDEIEDSLGLEAGHIQSALEALEAEGVVMRGHYTDELAGRGTRVVPGASPVQWCDRRLLARINQLTLTGLRRQVQAVETSVFQELLFNEHQLCGERNWEGLVGLREAVGKLQGFDLPAASWEQHVLANRVADYQPHALDQLFSCGELLWGRLVPPSRKPTSKTKRTKRSVTKAIAISLLIREDLAWLVSPAEESQSDITAKKSTSARDAEPTSTNVGLCMTDRLVAELKTYGAQFAQELAGALGSNREELNGQLRELSAAGIVTSDSFQAIRQVVLKPPSKKRRRDSLVRSDPTAGLPGAIGRWSLFPPRQRPIPLDERAESWCRLLLERYSIVFREIVTRESAAPRWYDLLLTFRRMEMRGQIRGGRFCQWRWRRTICHPEAVQKLTERLETIRAKPAASVLFPAADPLNLEGIVNDHERVTPQPENALLYRDGTCLAVRNGVDVEFRQEVSEDERKKYREQIMQFGLSQRATRVREQRLARQAKFRNRRTVPNGNMPKTEERSLPNLHPSPKLQRLTPMLICEDVPESIQFYVGLVGFELRDHLQDVGKSGWACLVRDEVELMLASPTFLPEPVSVDGSFPQAIYYFYVSEIEALKQRMEDAGYQTSELRTSFYDKREFDMLDPSGHLLWFGEDVVSESDQADQTKAANADSD